MSLATSETVCAQPKQIGTCGQYVQRYWYNPITRDCEMFTFSGCQGNDNNFVSLLDCQNYCRNTNRETIKYGPLRTRSISFRFQPNPPVSKAERTKTRTGISINVPIPGWVMCVRPTTSASTTASCTAAVPRKVRLRLVH